MSAHILSRLLPRVRAGASVPSASGSADIHPTLEVIGGDRFPLQALGRSYRPFPLIGSNRHVETIFAAFFRSLPDVRYRRECLRTADGGAVALDWPVGGDDQRLASDAPVLILLPGLTGGSGDTYVRHMLVRAKKNGWRVVVFNSRGCADSPVTTPQFYSASFTEDLRQVVYHVGHCFPYSKLYAAGWSLGANILVRYLGQEAHSCPLAGAASLCNPFDLVVADEDFHKGFNVIYDKALARALRRIFKKHALLFEGIGGEYNIELAANAKSVREFDDGLTRVSFGYKSVDDYYFDASSSHSIEHVQTPLLCIQASNDPIAPSRGIPREQIRGNPHCLLIVTPKGGHLGWVAGDEAPFGCPWTDPVVMEFFEHIQENKTDSPLHGAEGAPSCKASLGVMV
ncbi:embryogenesis-associated protein EMB8 isoform X1 [Nymphaea colorata]|nr:embryogenesis-associated protein EMB8 isoform X1 [Nymphaea colorata]